jgi:hypothetical protein
MGVSAAPHRMAFPAASATGIFFGRWRGDARRAAGA